MPVEAGRDRGPRRQEGGALFVEDGVVALDVAEVVRTMSLIGAFGFEGPVMLW